MAFIRLRLAGAPMDHATMDHAMHMGM
jgi:hypothetical protein